MVYERSSMLRYTCVACLVQAISVRNAYITECLIVIVLTGIVMSGLLIYAPLSVLNIIFQPVLYLLIFHYTF